MASIAILTLHQSFTTDHDRRPLGPLFITVMACLTITKLDQQTIELADHTQSTSPLPGD